MPHASSPPIPLSRALVAALVLGVLVAAALAVPTGARGAALAYGATAGTERALISLADGREELVLGLDLARPGPGSRSRSRPAVLVPVPAAPTVAPLTGRAARVFDDLELATRPVTDPGAARTASTADPATQGGVSVLGRERIGGYEVTRLPAGDAAALRRWLQRGGYATPARAREVLERDVRRGWGFVAIRLANPVPGDDATLGPLRIRFPTGRLVLPLRLSAARSTPVDVELYVAGEHRVVATGFDTYFAGFVSGLRPALPSEVRGLVRGRYLTRLGRVGADPSSVTSDAFPREAVSDRLFRGSTGYPYETEANFARGPLPSELPGARRAEETLDDAPPGALWLALFPAVGLAVLGVFGALRLRERLRGRH